MRKTKIITGGILAMAIVGVVASAEQSTHATKTASTQGSDTLDGAPPKMAVPTSEASAFKLWVAQEGTPPEKSAVRHVTRLSAHTGYRQVGIHTDWDSHFTCRRIAQAQQIATAYRNWQTGTGHVQVTVYASDGQIIPRPVLTERSAEPAGICLANRG
ncbi:hypothetical protein [Streptomyces murinus]|uniref:hypothetical protein n=1 Tax=Streptomyces murinus TaxID=33900 RepID=UPI00380DBEFF